MNASSHRRLHGFTLVEIMIVVLIVGILSSLALFTIGRIKEKALRTQISNNLRQLYSAKEFFYAETGRTNEVHVLYLKSQGYIRPSLADSILSNHSFELNNHWRYYWVVRPGQPVLCWTGVLPTDGRLTDSNSKQFIWYPAPPASLKDVMP
jgi:prepilin-type N-terminal cleavage/methylation domain-containing protein